MKHLGAILLATALVVTGCSSSGGDGPTTTTQADSRRIGVTGQERSQGAVPAIGSPSGLQASPSCFPYHDPRAQGPGPSRYGLEVQGVQPLFSGGAIRVIGTHWALSSDSVELLILPAVENAMWYGTKPDLVRCLEPLARSLGQAKVHDGAWEWEGTVPELQEGAAPVLVAVDESGRYYISELQLYGASGLVKPYTLAVESDTLTPGVIEISKQLPPVQPVAIGSPFRLIGTGLPRRSAPVRVHLDYRDEQGGDWVPVGSGELHGDRLETEKLTIPKVLEVLGTQRAAIVPATYRLVITNDQRPYEIYYLLSIELLPPKEGGP